MIDPKIIDADSHVLEPPNMWLDYIEPRFREKAPRLINTDCGGEKYWFCDEFTLGDGLSNLGGAGLIGARDGEVDYKTKELSLNTPKYVEARRGGFDPH